ncbi:MULTISPECIES: DNA-binding transcriptional regulator KdgR [Basfia]|uniref:IclR protein n=2 Tax=Basfia TaxID=697331 RepID=Q65V41_MANSM|nr:MULTISPECIES: DNA-binding transcriptional regulator KdgR [Basfia]AAU37169.1 IclR protein [[Mannheimia] succiniciproducens MBEL55E]QIM68013.1 DNA-binding transcriptional regulator KdgR [Basfia succiniciproducens]SCX86181.1 transcriptional regulator, IclR family [Basfia succiniciproducens]SEP63966.1 transcriptional regulator, IclR family [Basfia succiniciproducens]
MEKENQPEAVSSVLKVFGIIEALAEQKEIGITELAQRLMMSKSTTYRFLQTMKTLGFVSQEGETEKYTLTLKLFEVGAKALEYADIIGLANHEMSYISRQTNETLHLGTLDGTEIIYLHKIDSGYNLRMYSRIGRRNPIYSTAIGKVLLSGLTNKEIRELLADLTFVKHTSKTLENIDQLIEEIEKVRKQHYAEDNEEQEPGLRCVAAPIYNRFGRIIAGLSISIPTIRFEEEKLPQLVNLLQVAGKNISEQIGYHDYPEILAP